MPVAIRITALELEHEEFGIRNVINRDRNSINMSSGVLRNLIGSNNILVQTLCSIVH